MEKYKRSQFIVLENPVARFVDTTLEIAGYLSLIFINHTYLGGNGWLDVFMIILVLLWVSTIHNTRTKRFKTKQELKKWLDEKDGR